MGKYLQIHSSEPTWLQLLEVSRSIQTVPLTAGGGRWDYSDHLNSTFKEHRPAFERR